MRATEEHKADGLTVRKCRQEAGPSGTISKPDGTEAHDVRQECLLRHLGISKYSRKLI